MVAKCGYNVFAGVFWVVCSWFIVSMLFLGRSVCFLGGCYASATVF